MKGWVGLVGWPTADGRFTHISGHPSAVGRAQDSESSTVKDQRSTAVLRNQMMIMYVQTLDIFCSTTYLRYIITFQSFKYDYL